MRAQIRGIQEEIDNDRRSFDMRVRRANEGTGRSATSSTTWGSIASGTPTPSTARPSASTTHERTQFAVARKSARFWPIEGKTQEEIFRNLKDFCNGALGCPEGEDLGLVSAVRAKSAPKGRAYLEVIATFKDNSARDYIFSRGSYLASYKDASGRPTCGIRLHIPAHLMNSFKLLESYGVDLKRRHKHLIRKYVKFDEQAEDLYLHVKHDNDTDWLSFTPADAKKEMADKNTRNVIRSSIHGSPTLDNEALRPMGRRIAMGRRTGGLGVGGGPVGGVSGAGASGSGHSGDRDEEETMDQGELEQGQGVSKKWNPPPRQ